MNVFPHRFAAWHSQPTETCPFSPPILTCPAFPLPLPSIILHSRNTTASSHSECLTDSLLFVALRREESLCLYSLFPVPILLNLSLPLCSQGTVPLNFHRQSLNWVQISSKAKKQEFLWTCKCVISWYLWFPNIWCPVIQSLMKPSGSNSTHATGCSLGRHHNSMKNRL